MRAPLTRTRDRRSGRGCRVLPDDEREPSPVSARDGTECGRVMGYLEESPTPHEHPDSAHHMPGAELRSSARRHSSARAPLTTYWITSPRQAPAGPLNPSRPLQADLLPRPTIARPACRRGHRGRARQCGAWRPGCCCSRRSSHQAAPPHRRRPPSCPTPGEPIAGIESVDFDDSPSLRHGKQYGRV